jgi:nicotinate-nucleotide--dimethylbenzimidazole phosphoribosyltransferase
MDFKKLNEQIPDLNETAASSAKARWDYIAKPVGSLGEIETIITRIAAVTGGDMDISRRAVIILAADNGVTAHGVSSSSSEVTALLAGFMAKRQSSVCIMAKCAKTDVILRDMGMFRRVEGVEGPHIADGTADMYSMPAMTESQCEAAIEYGINLAAEAKSAGVKLIATGEMGIGNTATSAAITAVLLGESVPNVTGRGVGLDDEKLRNKISVIEHAIEVNGFSDWLSADSAAKPGMSSSPDLFEVLRRLGGFDIAGLCGVFIGGAINRIPVIIDGVISGAAALCAARLCPKAKNAMIASHISAEPASGKALKALGLTPIIHAGMRLGEGTGAVALIPLIDMGMAVYSDMITYGDLGM